MRLREVNLDLGKILYYKIRSWGTSEFEWNEALIGVCAEYETPGGQWTSRFGANLFFHQPKKNFMIQSDRKPLISHHIKGQVKNQRAIDAGDHQLHKLEYDSSNRMRTSFHIH